MSNPSKSARAKQATQLIDDCNRRIDACISLLEGARLELVNKKFKRPEELTGSAKLYRVVDDVECARNCLSQVAIDVRNATGNNQRY